MVKRREASRPAGGVEGDATYVVQVPVRDEDCLLVHRRLRAAPDVKGQLAPGQYQACLLSGSQQHVQVRHGAVDASW